MAGKFDKNKHTRDIGGLHGGQFAKTKGGDFKNFKGSKGSSKKSGLYTEDGKLRTFKLMKLEKLKKTRQEAIDQGQQNDPGFAKLEMEIALREGESQNVPEPGEKNEDGFEVKEGPFGTGVYIDPEDPSIETSVTKPFEAPAPLKPDVDPNAANAALQSAGFDAVVTPTGHAVILDPSKVRKKVPLTLTQRKRIVELADAGAKGITTKSTKPFDYLVDNGLASKIPTSGGNVIYVATPSGLKRAEEVSAGKSVKKPASGLGAELDAAVAQLAGDNTPTPLVTENLAPEGPKPEEDFDEEFNKAVEALGIDPKILEPSGAPGPALTPKSIENAIAVVSGKSLINGEWVVFGSDTSADGTPHGGAQPFQVTGIDYNNEEVNLTDPAGGAVSADFDDVFTIIEPPPDTATSNAPKPDAEPSFTPGERETVVAWLQSAAEDDPDVAPSYLQQAALIEDGQLSAVDWGIVEQGLIEVGPGEPPDVDYPSALRKVQKTGDPAPISAANAPDAGGFPALDDLVVEGSAGGTTGAKFAHDKNGNRYVVKDAQGAVSYANTSKAHLESEIVADEVYRTMGAAIPAIKRYEDPNGGPIKVSKFIENAMTWNEAEFSANDAELKDFRDNLADHFAVDAWMATWDVIGVGNESPGANVLYDGNNAYRIDNGGALGFKGMGDPKGDLLKDDVPELARMRKTGPGENVNGRVFGHLSDAEVAAQIDRDFTDQKFSEVLGMIPDTALKQKMAKRWNFMKEWADDHRAVPGGKPLLEAQPGDKVKIIDGDVDPVGDTLTVVGPTGGVPGEVTLEHPGGGQVILPGDTHFGDPEMELSETAIFTDFDGNILANLPTAGASAGPTPGAPLSEGKVGDLVHNTTTGLEWTIAEDLGDEFVFAHANGGLTASVLKTSEVIKLGPSPTGGAFNEAISKPPTPPAPKAGQFPSNHKQVNSLTNADGFIAKLKDLDLQPGDKIQMKKGGWDQEVVSVNPFGSVKVKGVNTGKVQTLPGSGTPLKVAKADGSKLSLKSASSTSGPALSTPSAPSTSGPTLSGPLPTAADVLAGLPANETATLGDLGVGSVFSTPSGKIKVVTEGGGGAFKVKDIETGAVTDMSTGLVPPFAAKNGSPIAIKAAAVLGSVQSKPEVKAAAAEPPGGSPPPSFASVPKNAAAEKIVKAAAAKTPATSFTKAETNAISAYTNGAYDSINGALRNPSPDKKVPANAAEDIAQLDSAIQRAAPLDQDVVLSRRVGKNTWNPNVQVGDVMQDLGFISASTDENKWSGPVHLRILAKKGQKGLWVNGTGGSEHPGEKEYLLPRGTMVRVVKKVNSGIGNSGTTFWVEIL